MPKLTVEQRRLASVDLSLTYLNNYYVEWRYTKVLTIEKLIQNRYEFYEELTDKIKSNRDINGKPTIAQEVHNGLYFDAIAQCVQYIEDLFALLKASKQPDYFIKNIVTYNAGHVTGFIKSFKAELKEVAALFHYPFDLKYDDSGSKEKYDRGCETLTGYIAELVQFYKDYEFLYNQYKHGLAVAMRPLGNIYTAEQVEKDKAGELLPFLAVYDNFNLQAGFKKGTARTTQGIMMPGFTENVGPVISKLAEENNYLRFVFPVDVSLSIHLLVQKAQMTYYCMQLFMINYSQKISANSPTIKFVLPTDYQSKTYTQCTYSQTED